jgi:uncharacterized membrane protein YfcA
METELFSGLSGVDVTLIGLAFFVAGLVKGILGLGIPFIIIPVVTAVTDVVTALALVALPTIIPNLVQLWQFRQHRLEFSHTAMLVAGLVPGVWLGAVMLVDLQTSSLVTQILGGMLLLYLGSRVVRSPLTLTSTMSKGLAIPAGFGSGFLGGLVGISAPISLTYLSAQRLERPQFIFPVSIFFGVIGSCQVRFYLHQGLADYPIIALSSIGLVPLFVGMYLGQVTGKYLSQSSFEKLVLAVLCVIGLKLVLDI